MSSSNPLILVKSNQVRFTMQIAKIIFQQGFQDLEMSIRRQVKITSSLMPKRRPPNQGRRVLVKPFDQLLTKFLRLDLLNPKTNFC